tara:strand:- start:438 stop:1439 length:1002 start_codon:yes stop_codon:yes gene_type:complete
MIIKSQEINNINLKKNKFFLLYGKNEGLKKETILKILKNKDEISSYDEKEVLDNSNIFIESLISKSLFENEKIIIIKRATDKILKVIEKLNEKKIEDLIIIINSDHLEKKSKLRTYFEKSKEYICLAFYPDNEQTLSRLATLFFKERKISISPSNINLIIKKTNGDREMLYNEINKIAQFSTNGKKISEEIIAKLTNLNEDHNVSELVDNCLAKNKKKIDTILNENNFTNEDCILITRIFLNKSKKILKLSEIYEENKSIDLTISNARPPIFWKDKEITKQQLHQWSSKEIKILIYKLNEIELLIKKNLNNSINLITNFILEITSLKNTNNST